MTQEEFEQTINDLDRLYGQMMASQARSKAFKDDAMKAVGEVIAKHFPEAHHLEPQEYQKLAYCIWQHIDKLDTDLDKIVTGKGMKWLDEEVMGEKVKRERCRENGE